MRKMFLMILAGMAIGGAGWSVLAGETKARMEDSKGEMKADFEEAKGGAKALKEEAKGNDTKAEVDGLKAM